MKRFLNYFSLIVILSCILTGKIFAQAPESFLYQAEARDSQGKTLTDEILSVKVNILQNTIKIYQETHTIKTDKNGLFNIKIGTGESEAGSNFQSIEWSKGSYFLNIQIAIGESTFYMDMGTSQLLSVPYALFAKNAENGISSGSFKFYYPDKDNDGFGDENKEVYSPVMPDGYITVGGDCDDNNDLVNPNAEEISDGIDNNCDGEIDEGFKLESVTLEIDGFVPREILNVSYSFSRTVNAVGQPTSMTRIDGIKITLKPLYGNTELAEWVCDSYARKDGKIIYRIDGNVIREFEFFTGYLIFYREKYDELLIEEIEISPNSIKIGGGEVQMEWAQ